MLKISQRDCRLLRVIYIIFLRVTFRFMLKSLGLWGDADESKQQIEEVASSSVALASARSPVPSVRSREDEPSSDISSSQQQGCGSAVSTRVRQTAASLPAPLKQV
jgi:hypothetical protein